MSSDLGGLLWRLDALLALLALMVLAARYERAEARKRALREASAKWTASIAALGVAFDNVGRTAVTAAEAAEKLADAIRPMIPTVVMLAESYKKLAQVIVDAGWAQPGATFSLPDMRGRYPNTQVITGWDAADGGNMVGVPVVVSEHADPDKLYLINDDILHEAHTSLYTDEDMLHLSWYGDWSDDRHEHGDPDTPVQ